VFGILRLDFVDRLEDVPIQHEVGDALDHLQGEVPVFGSAEVEKKAPNGPWLHIWRKKGQLIPV
jgi:hypothetical protein